MLVEKLNDFDINVLRKFAKVDTVSQKNSTKIIAAPVFNNDGNDDQNDRDKKRN